MTEQRCFIIPAKGDIAEVSEELDAALSLGWRYVTALSCGGGLIVILERPLPPKEQSA